MSEQSKDSVLQLENYLPYRLSILSNKISSIVADVYKVKFALSITEWRIMAVLGEYDGISADEVSIKTQIEKSLISRAVSKLLKRHLIERSISDEDKRRSELSLSEMGQDIYAEIVPLSLMFERKLLDYLSEEQQHQLDEIIDVLQEHASKLRL
ncbi:MAG: MarR family transcriptional regulator [Pseudomonadota bacterium]